jgi:hypothetical protein
LETEDNNSNEEMYEDFININDIMSELDTESTPKSVLEHILKNSKFNRDGYKEPTLDELLDKGINNLTNKEKELLYDYSKRI